MRDDFLSKAKRVLAARAGYLCSNPGCRAPTAGPQLEQEGVVNVGKAAHITAASAGGPRRAPGQTPQQRKAAANGVWLCAICADIVDKDPKRYPMELLRQWKAQAEHEARRRLGKPRVLADRADLKLYLLPLQDLEEPGSGVRPSAPPAPTRGARYRIQLANEGPAVARHVEAIVHDLEVGVGEGWDRVDSFIPSNLRWADSSERVIPVLVPHARRVLEVAELRPTEAGDLEISFALVSPAVPTDYIIDWRKAYQFKLTVVAENAEPTWIVLEFGLPGRNYFRPVTPSSLTGQD